MKKAVEAVACGRYEAIDGLRAFSAIGIALMHIRANAPFSIDGFIYNRLIPSFTNLVFLFMVISAFGLCCGYYEKIINNNIAVGEFYSKRYKKIWPCFALLCILELLISPSINSLYETFANLTLCFGLLPNANISVIGVGWFLGVVFVFYLLFPFFCWLLQDKRRAWFAFCVMVVFNWICREYFFDESHVIDGFSPRINFVYCSMFFMAGGMVFIYKELLGQWVKKSRWGVLMLCILSAACYYMVGETVLIMLLLFSLVLIYALHSGGALKGKQESGGVKLGQQIIRFIGGISMEIYLCHMIVFRVVERIGLLHMFSNDVLNYLVVSFGVIMGAVAFSMALNKGIGLFFEMVK